MIKCLFRFCVILLSACEPGPVPLPDAAPDAAPPANLTPWEQSYTLVWQCLGACDVEPPIPLYPHMTLSESASALVFWITSPIEETALRGVLDLDETRQCARGLLEIPGLPPVALCAGQSTTVGRLFPPEGTATYWSFSAAPMVAGFSR